MSAPRVTPRTAARRAAADRLDASAPARRKLLASPEAAPRGRVSTGGDGKGKGNAGRVKATPVRASGDRHRLSLGRHDSSSASSVSDSDASHDDSSGSSGSSSGGTSSSGSGSESNPAPPQPVKGKKSTSSSSSMGGASKNAGGAKRSRAAPAAGKKSSGGKSAGPSRLKKRRVHPLTIELMATAMDAAARDVVSRTTLARRSLVRRATDQLLARCTQQLSAPRADIAAIHKRVGSSTGSAVTKALSLYAAGKRAPGAWSAAASKLEDALLADDMQCALLAEGIDREAECLEAEEKSLARYEAAAEDVGERNARLAERNANPLVAGEIEAAVDDRKEWSSGLRRVAFPGLPASEVYNPREDEELVEIEAGIARQLAKVEACHTASRELLGRLAALRDAVTESP